MNLGKCSNEQRVFLTPARYDSHSTKQALLRSRLLARQIERRRRHIV